MAALDAVYLIGKQNRIIRISWGSLRGDLNYFFVYLTQAFFDTFMVAGVVGHYRFVEF